jgi:hypothetical protein
LKEILEENKKNAYQLKKIPECPRNFQKTIRGRLKLDLTAYL